MTSQKIEQKKSGRDDNATDCNKAEIRLNTVIHGEPAEWLLEWKKRGLVLSNTDAVVRAFEALQRQIVDDDRKNAERKTIMRTLGKE